MRFALILAILVATLALFNPSHADFQAFVQDKLQETISDHARAAGGGLFGEVAGALGGALAGAFASGVVERDNYVVCSVYTVDLDGPNRDAEEWRFLGVAGQFIPLKKPASLPG